MKSSKIIVWCVSGKPYNCMIKFFGQTLFLRQQLSSMASEIGPVATSIYKKLSDLTNPNHLEVINESYMHNVPKGSETHFKVVVVSKTFEGLALIKVMRDI
jgi:stress-induced morphogen